MRIPIKALKEFSEKYKLTHVIVLAHDENGETDHVATYGRTIEQCSQAADFGNKLKDELGWPQSLHKQPLRVQRLQKRIKELKEKLKGIIDMSFKYKTKQEIDQMSPEEKYEHARAFIEHIVDSKKINKKTEKSY